MSYIDRNLLSEERILFRTKKHLIIFFFPLILTIFLIYTTNYMYNDPILNKIALVPWIIALLFWGYTGIEYWTSEFVVTNKRIMMREGFFNRHSNETRLATVAQVTVNQSLLGVYLNYGTIIINAMGAYDAFGTIDKPLQFQRAVNEQLDKITS